MFLPLRPSESDRLRTVGALKRGYVTGRLSTETFEERLAVAHTARSRAALRALLADISARWLAAHAVLRARSAETVPAAPAATLLLSRCPRSALVIGRSRGCDIVFGDEGVSRRHARVERVGEQWYVTDLSSTNGTYVDGVRVERAPVGRGCRLWLGAALLEIE